tara:strand:+ start:3992 stop:4828 length:837 start_codon:yes stop_codon:yes gene_type:complete
MEKFKKQSDVAQMAKAALDLLNTCKNNKLNIWLDWGGLLGMIRSEGLIPWNNDLELSCKYEKNINKKMIKVVDVLSSMGYLVFYYPTIGTMNIKKNNQDIDINLNIIWKENNFAVRPHEEVYKFSNKIKSENYKLKLSNYSYWISRISCVYFKFHFKSFIESKLKEKLKMIISKSINVIPIKFRKYIFLFFLNLSQKLGANYTKTAIPFQYFEEFIEIEFYGGMMPIPKRNIELLNYIYGKDWRIPAENWTFYKKGNENVSNMQFINDAFEYSKLDLI